jgi:tRNA pseudouridine38-40 synthase
MPRYFIELTYKGTNYVGWQMQKNGNSVQGTIEKALNTILSEKVSITGAGRTDSGVHAAYMVAHFDTVCAINDCSKLSDRLNKIIPKDIAIISVSQVKDDTHSRFSAVSRKYEYHISFEKNPFIFDFVHAVNYKLDFDAMNIAAKTLLNYSDFTSFSKLHSNNKTNICNIKQSFWEIREDRWVYIIEADRFLRNMVRAIVGTLLDVGRNKIDISQFITIIESRNRSKASTSASAKGLYLVDVKYPDNLFTQSVRKNRNK